MKVVKKEDRETIKNSDVCHALEYPFDEDSLNSSVIRLRGRYPSKGFVMNRESDEIGYVLRGSGCLVTAERECELAVGDMVFIPRNEKYYWDGTMELLISCSPAWKSNQHEHFK